MHGDTDTTEFSAEQLARASNESILPRWDENGVLRVLDTIAEHEAEFVRRISLRTRGATTSRALGGYGWITEDPTFGLRHVSTRESQGRGFVDAGVFREITGVGLNSKTGQKGGYNFIFNGNFRLEIEAPTGWSNTDVAQYIIDILHGNAGTGMQGLEADSLAALYEDFLREKLSAEANNSGVTVETVMAIYRERVATGMQRAAGAARLFIESSIGSVPGTGLVMTLHDLSEDNYVSAVIGMMTLGIPALAWLRGAADGVVLELGSEITHHFTSRAMHAMENLTPAQVKTIVASFDGLQTAEEKIEAIYRFFARNAQHLDNLKGTLVPRSGIARRVLDMVGDAQHQAHHLITAAEAGNSSAMKAAEAVGYNINRAENLMKLPATRELAILENLPLHLGRHPINSEAGEYLRFVRLRLIQMDETWKATRSYQRLFNDISKLEQELFDGLQNLRWTLTHQDPRLG